MTPQKYSTHIEKFIQAELPTLDEGDQNAKPSRSLKLELIDRGAPMQATLLGAFNQISEDQVNRITKLMRKMKKGSKRVSKTLRHRAEMNGK